METLINFFVPYMTNLMFSGLNLYYKGKLMCSNIYNYISSTRLFTALKGSDDKDVDTVLYTNVFLINTVKDHKTKTITLNAAASEDLAKYDLVFVQLLIPPQERLKYDVLMGRQEPGQSTLAERDIIPSQVHFWSIKFLSGEKTCIKIDFQKLNYYVVGNILFDRAFLTWYLHTSHGYELLPTNTDYKVTFIDDNMDFRSVCSQEHVRINLSDYTVEKNE
jgi:hypothetical protein